MKPSSVMVRQGLYGWADAFVYTAIIFGFQPDGSIHKAAWRLFSIHSTFNRYLQKEQIGGSGGGERGRRGGRGHCEERGEEGRRGEEGEVGRCVRIRGLDSRFRFPVSSLLRERDSRFRFPIFSVNGIPVSGFWFRTETGSPFPVSSFQLL